MEDQRRVKVQVVTSGNPMATTVMVGDFELIVWKAAVEVTPQGATLTLMIQEDGFQIVQQPPKPAPDPGLFDGPPAVSC